MTNIRDYLQKNRMVTDGAMGTYFDMVEEQELVCSEECNISNPDFILNIHKRYIDQGAQLLRSNTFMANADALEKMKIHNPDFQNLTVKDLVKSGYAICREAELYGRGQGKEVFAAADIGPLVENADTDREALLKQYYEICDGFLEEKADVFVLETFPDTYYVLKMAAYIKNHNPKAWILGQFSFMPTGFGSTGFHYSTVFDKAFESGLLDAVGLNCGIGAYHMERFFREYLKDKGIPEGVHLSALPNCGYPQIVRGKAVYSDSVPYFSSKLKEIAELGINILGGCCGTDPNYIAAIAQWVHQETIPVPKKILPVTEVKKEKEVKAKSNSFAHKIRNGQKVFAVELDPPFDADCSKLIHAAQALRGSKADIITLADSPLGRSRADSLLMAAKVKRESGIQVMPHLSSRDRNRIAIRGGVLGAYLNDIRNYLLVTGDPVPRSDRDNTKSVFDFNSIQCMRYVKHMNESLFPEDPVFYGGALNQDGINMEAIANRMKKKMEEGCSFFLTQPVYTDESVEKLRILKEMTDANILVGILPLVSYRNALFMKNEMPGIHVSEELVALYEAKDNRQDWEKIAVDYSLKMMHKCEDIGQGYYMMTPFNRVSLVKEILEAF